MCNDIQGVQQTLSELKHGFSSAVEVCTTVLISLLNSLPEICLWLVYGGISTFLDAPSSAHWYIQKLRNMSTTTDSSVFCNNKVAMGLRELFAFTHHKRLLLWDPGWSMFYKPSVRTESADIRLHRQGEGLLLKQTDISWFLGFPCIFAPPFHHIFNPHSLCHSALLFYGLSLTSGENVPSIARLKIYLLEKKYWHIQYLFSPHMLRLMTLPPPKRKRLE